MCAQVPPSAEYLRGHGRVAVNVTALRRLWQHLPVLGLVILACVPVCCGCGLSTSNKDDYYYLVYRCKVEFIKCNLRYISCSISKFC